MNQIKVGIVVDYENYEDYFNRFNDKYPLNVIEFHLIEEDLNDFPEKLGKMKEFIEKNKIEHISFHSPDRLMQSVLFEESDFEKDKEKFYLLLDELKKLGSELNQDIVLVVHQGIKLPKKVLDIMSDEEIAKVRDEKLKQAKKSYDMLIEYTKNSKLSPMLENSPPGCSFDDDEHFVDVAFEDIQDRIGNNGFVFDLSHAVMSFDYFRTNNPKRKFAALEYVKKRGVPESLQSIENYIKKAGKNIKWMHISDANGFLGENEGLVIGTEGCLIDWKKIMDLIAKEVKNPICVLELVGGHKNYKLIENSMNKVKEWNP